MGLLEAFPSPQTFDKLQWGVFGLHLLLAMVFVVGAVSFYRQGKPAGMALQLSLAIMISALGLTVARITGRRL